MRLAHPFNSIEVKIINQRKTRGRRWLAEISIKVWQLAKFDLDRNWKIGLHLKELAIP